MTTTVDERNARHADHPQVGDRWYERGHIPICTVVEVTDRHVIIKRHRSTALDVMLRVDFARSLRYGPSSERKRWRHRRTWCDVVPANSIGASGIPDRPVL